MTDTLTMPFSPPPRVFAVALGSTALVVATSVRNQRSCETAAGRLRDECLNVHQFLSVAAAQTKIEAWRLRLQSAPTTRLWESNPIVMEARRKFRQALIEQVSGASFGGRENRVAAPVTAVAKQHEAVIKAVSELAAELGAKADS